MLSFRDMIDVAKISVEDFQQKLKEVSPNVRDWAYEPYDGLGMPLVFGLVGEVEDSKLPPILTVLINEKAELTLWEGRSILACAALHGKQDTIRFLINNQFKDNAIIYWAIHNNDTATAIPIIKMLIDEYKADVNVKVDGETALLKAIKLLDLAVIKCLLANDASLLANKDGVTPLLQAYKFQHFSMECFNILMDAACQSLSRKATGIGKVDEKLLADILRADIKALAGSVAESAALESLLQKEILPRVLKEAQKARELQQIWKKREYFPGPLPKNLATIVLERVIYRWLNPQRTRADVRRLSVEDNELFITTIIDNQCEKHSLTQLLRSANLQHLNPLSDADLEHIAGGENYILRCGVEKYSQTEQAKNFIKEHQKKYKEKIHFVHLFVVHNYTEDYGVTLNNLLRGDITSFHTFFKELQLFFINNLIVLLDFLSKFTPQVRATESFGFRFESYEEKRPQIFEEFKQTAAQNLITHNESFTSVSNDEFLLAKDMAVFDSDSRKEMFAMRVPQVPRQPIQELSQYPQEREIILPPSMLNYVVLGKAGNVTLLEAREISAVNFDQVDHYMVHDALLYVYETRLSKPFADPEKYDKEVKLYNDETKQEVVIPRNNHGLAHAARQVVNMRDALNLFAAGGKTKKIKEFCQGIKKSPILHNLLAAAVVFLSAGRENEKSFDQDVAGYKAARLKSRVLFKEFIDKNYGFLFAADAPPEVKRIGDILNFYLPICEEMIQFLGDPNYLESIGRDFKNMPSDFNLARLIIFHLFNTAHILDVPRCMKLGFAKKILHERVFLSAAGVMKPAPDKAEDFAKLEPLWKVALHRLEITGDRLIEDEEISLKGRLYSAKEFISSSTSPKHVETLLGIATQSYYLTQDLPAEEAKQNTQKRNEVAFKFLSYILTKSVDQAEQLDRLRTDLKLMKLVMWAGEHLTENPLAIGDKHGQLIKEQCEKVQSCIAGTQKGSDSFEGEWLSKELVEALDILKKAKILLPQYRAALFQAKSYQDRVARAIVDLHKANLTKESVLVTLVACPEHASKLATAFLKLQDSCRFYKFVRAVSENADQSIELAEVFSGLSGRVTLTVDSSLIKFVVESKSLINSQNIKKVVGAIAALLENNILIFENLRGLLKLDDVNSIYVAASGLRTLHLENILYQYRDIYFENATGGCNLAAAIITLHEYGLVKPENIAVVMNSKGMYPARALVILHQANILTDKNRLAIQKHASPVELAEMYSVLDQAGIRDYEEKVANYSSDYLLFAISALKKQRILSQPIFDFLLEQKSEKIELIVNLLYAYPHPNILAEPSVLKLIFISFFKISDTKDAAEKFAKGIFSLFQSKPLTEEAVNFLLKDCSADFSKGEIDNGEVPVVKKPKHNGHSFFSITDTYAAKPVIPIAPSHSSGSKQSLLV